MDNVVNYPKLNTKYILPSCSKTPEVRIKSIATNAEVEINTATPVSCYVRSGKEMIRSACNYYEDGSLENAYLLYMRFLIIFVEKISHHPGYKSLPSVDKKSMKSLCQDALSKTEIIKKELHAQFEVEHDNYKHNVEIRKQEEAEAERKRQEELERDARYRDGLAKLNQGITNDYSGRRINSPTSPTSSELIADYPQAPYSSNSNHFDLDGHLRAGAGAYDNNAANLPAFDRTSKPSRILSPISAGLRNVVIPGDLVPEFLKIAKTNTSANIETCGILAGKIIREVLVITHLIIPKQKGTADSCTTENEEQIFGYQDKFNLITIGWIHTHPTQTAFLSSVDLHTHYSYQLMMPEAIALVCAPAKNETGIFMLNPTSGMDTIGSCQATGFHPHNQTSDVIFQDASHADYDFTRNATICDLRYQKS